MEGISRKTALAFAVAALLALPIGMLTATAHTQTYKTNVSIHYDKKDATVWGHLGTASFCQDDRSVTVHRDGSPIATTTSSNGFFSVASAGPGSYSATVAASHATSYGHDHTCLAGSSHSVSVP